MNPPIPADATADEVKDLLGITRGERADVIRTGERQPITTLVRKLVYRRDDWTCQQCHQRMRDVLQLDHIVPWSAGGSDRTYNLRTLCKPCNDRRSNFVTGKEKSAMPIVRICAPCLCVDAIDPPESAFPVYCGTHCHESWAIPGWHIL